MQEAVPYTYIHYDENGQLTFASPIDIKVRTVYCYPTMQ